MLRNIKNFYLFEVEPLEERLKTMAWHCFGHKNPALEAVRNSYKGERCFIVCNGPSLTIEDLDKLKGEYTFSMNSVIRRLKETVWRPTFYGIQDLNVYQNIPYDVCNLKCKYKFVSRSVLQAQLPIPTDAIFFDHLAAGHYSTNPNPIFHFGTDLTKGIYDGYSITYSLLQIAVYMGFTDIYIIGCDCSYSADPSKQHFAASGHIDKNASRAAELMIKAFEYGKRICDQKRIKVYNATRGGALEVFPRVDLDELLKEK